MSYDDDIDAFTITREREILFQLHQLIIDNEPLSVFFDDGQESMLTMAINLDEEQGLLYLDWGGSEAVNQRLLATEKATFVANPLGVRNQFHTGGMRKAMYQERPAFVTAIPHKYVRLQRREFFRLSLPVVLRLPCWFYLKPDGSGPRYQATVVDIGIGGIGFEPATVLRLAPGQVISSVAIDFGKHGLMHTDLEIRHSYSQARGMRQVTHIGCRFVHIDRADENTVQRFIIKAQADERAKFG
jgi:c-di-GMP-binding flagellar brake protein YcgR